VGEKLTPRRKSAILRKMREGHYAKTAAESSGITEQTLYNWLKKGEDAERHPEHVAFLEAYRKAEAEAEEKAIKAVQAAFADDWRAAMTYLERRHPGRWAKRQNVDVTSEGQPLRTVEVVRPCPPRESSGLSSSPIHPTS
jgi:transposase